MKSKTPALKLIVGALALSLGSAFGQERLGGISASVVGDKSIHPDSLSIAYERNVSLPDLMGRDRGVALTDKLGRISISELPLGSYSLCVLPIRGSSYISGCQWGDYRTTVVLNNAGIQQASVPILRGHVFRLKLIDPLGLLGRDSLTRMAKPSSMFVRNGMGDPVHFLKTEEGPDYVAMELVVPPNQKYRLTAAISDVILRQSPSIPSRSHRVDVDLLSGSANGITELVIYVDQR